MTLSYDEKYFPDCGTVVTSVPNDLADLWNVFPEQADVFVARALIDDPPRLDLHFWKGEPLVWDFLWGVGGDTITNEENLATMIDGIGTDDIDRPRHPDEIQLFLTALEKLEAAVIRAKARIANLKGENGRGSQSHAGK